MEIIIGVVINGVRKQIVKREYTFQEIVTLAYGGFDEFQRSYTIVTTTKKEDGGKLKQTFSMGDIISLQEDMRINVDSTNRS